MNSSTVINAKQVFNESREQQWIDLAKQGDQQAFFHLYQEYHKRVYALCFRMLANQECAEDVCQEVFVQLWQKITNFRGESKFSTWLHSVATNIVLGHLRKNKNWLQKVFSIETKSVEPGVIEQSTEMAELPELDKHILRLPEKARLVFVLFAVEGYRHEEISNMLNMAVGTSKAQYHRARNLLREWISDE